jgi:hypothetical protein
MLKITPIGKYQVELLEDFTRYGITVPKGYRFDGASIPRIFWSIFHPFMYLKSSVIHDYLYDEAIFLYEYRQKYIEAHKLFKKADSVFLDALKEDDRNVAKLFYHAVRLYRWFKFPKKREYVS